MFEDTIELITRKYRELYNYTFVNIGELLMKKYIEPKFGEDGFNCPHCGIYAHQIWRNCISSYRTNSRQPGAKFDIAQIPEWSTSLCARCGKFSFWYDKKLIYPKSSIAPLPNEDMPKNVKDDFLEARNIVNDSPRGACALLRLSLQKLMPHLGESGKNLNEDIKNLVSKGISSDIQQALDSVRIIGNDAVHPGELDLKDDLSTAISLFHLINYIVNNQISSKKEINKIFEGLPKHKLKGISNRDK